VNDPERVGESFEAPIDPQARPPGKQVNTERAPVAEPSIRENVRPTRLNDEPRSVARPGFGIVTTMARG